MVLEGIETIAVCALWAKKVPLRGITDTLCGSVLELERHGGHSAACWPQPKADFRFKIFKIQKIFAWREEVRD